ncbi:reverse transcriptase [Gossypium australe]|uniref:Reverse transcriptase n=1 Tax=Gossypium australe TaxID=47621 RepID=A0A5B6UZ37_9ROSI|nr:reverse transcriptase [Gossypium australe]
MAPFKALYGIRTPLYRAEMDEKRMVGPKLVSPWTKVLSFGHKGKLSLRFIGPYEVAERISLVAYLLKFPRKLDQIHGVLHVSMLIKYHVDPSHIVPANEIEVLRLARRKFCETRRFLWLMFCGETARLVKLHVRQKKQIAVSSTV